MFPDIYPKLSRRTRINWDVHVVSLVQSCLINSLALYVMFKDEERYDMQRSAVERIYGYTGASGLVQAFATGYFVWDLVVSARHYKVFGPGILAHAVTALSVFSLGFVSATARYLSLTQLTSNPATLLQLLWTGLYPLRAIYAFPQHPLVLRQAQQDRVQTAVV